MKQQLAFRLRFVLSLGLMALSCLGSARSQDARQKPPSQPDQQKQSPGQPTESNPFPQDTTNVPVLPNAKSPDIPEASYAPPPPANLPAGDADPVRSPDDPVGDAAPVDSNGFSSSSSGLDKFVPPPADDDSRRRRGGKKQEEPATHQETAKEHETVAAYYLDKKNWRAALSRYESAVVLDPENPDVYWGLAESQRHLGQFGAAKSNYLKVMEYDPDSRHAKEAQKLLSEPELASAPAATAAPRP